MSQNCEPSLHDVFQLLPPHIWAELLPQVMHTFSTDLVELVGLEWKLFGRTDQQPDPPPAKPIWLVLGGRGAGKTRTGAEWVKGLALGHQPYATTAVARIALVGETQGQVRDVMIEGVSGLLAIHNRWERPVWSPSRRRLDWPNGSAHRFSRPRIRRRCAVPNSVPPGRTNWRNGRTCRSAGTCCSSGSGWARPRAR